MALTETASERLVLVLETRMAGCCCLLLGEGEEAGSPNKFIVIENKREVVLV